MIINNKQTNQGWSKLIQDGSVGKVALMTFDFLLLISTLNLTDRT